MKFSYYPGCTLKTKAKDLDAYGRRSAEALGITLEELPEWQCCGAVYPMAKDEIATKLSSVRALVSARELGNDLVTLCSACHHVIKRVNGDMQNDDNVRLKVNNYLQLETPYEGETKVLHYLEMLRDVVGFDELKKKVVNPLKGRKIGAYYGCMLLRPSKEMQFDNPENPTIIEDFIKAIGGTPVIYPFRNECCGGYETASPCWGAGGAHHRMSPVHVQSGCQQYGAQAPDSLLYRASGRGSGREIRRVSNAYK